MARVWFWLAAFSFIVPLNAKDGAEDWTGRETLNATAVDAACAGIPRHRRTGLSPGH